MEIREFVELVNDPEVMSQYPVFLAAFVVPAKEAFRQFVFEVLCLETFTADEWMAEEFRMRQGWPQSIEAAYNTFVKEFYNE